MVLTLTLSCQTLLMFFIIVLTQWISNTTQELEDMLVDTQHFKIEQKEVEKAFLKIKVNKSHGPDKICGRLLKSCAVQLSHVFNYIFNMSLKEQHVPEILKGAIIVPVPKSSCPKTLSDFRPVALTSILMKTFEKMVRAELLRKTECVLDPLQFAYRPHRRVEDDTVTLFNSILSHLEGPGSHARLLFVDFSSAFNTIQPHILTNRLLEQFDVSKNLAGWILNFLTCRTQRVRIN